MSVFLQKRWVLFVVLILFIAFKIPHLFYPYYWDESAPYMAAITALCKHGISLLPSALDPLISRGHPLFFHALAATWMKIFGPSHLAMHSFALLISVLFLLFIYEAMLRLFSMRAAILGLVFMSTQLIFFIQASFLLPEVLVAFLSLLSIYCYISRKYLLTILSLTALFYTKESGLVVGLVLGADTFVSCFIRKQTWRERLLPMLSVAIPYLAIAAFFIVQKHTRGWYLFPEHTSLMVLSWQGFWHTFRMECLHISVYDTYRYWYYAIPLATGLLAAIKNKKPVYAAICIPIVIVYYFVDDMRAGRPMPSIPFFILFLTGSIFFLYTFSNRHFHSNPVQRRFVLLTGLFAIAYLSFSALNFITPRYFITAIAALLLVMSAFTDLYIRHSFQWLFYPALAAILLVSTLAYLSDDGYGDIDPGAFPAMQLQQDVVDFLVHNNGYDKYITTGSFMEYQHLANPATGYLRTERHFTHLEYEISAQTDYLIFDGFDRDNRYDLIKDNPDYRLVFSGSLPHVWAKIYQKIK